MRSAEEPTVRAPLGNISVRRRPFAFVALLMLTTLLAGIQMVVNRPLHTGAAPRNIVSFELARTPGNAQRTLDSWDADARRHARLGLMVDYLFLCAYAPTVALGCLLAGDKLRQRRWPLARASALLAWGGLLAGLLDAVENAALLVQMARNRGSNPWAALAWACASLKFLLVGAAIIYGAWAVLAWAAGAHRSRGAGGSTRGTGPRSWLRRGRACR